MEKTNMQHKSKLTVLSGAIFSKYIAPFKFSYVVGSMGVFFSLSSCAVPLIGAFGGSAMTMLFFAAAFLLRMAYNPTAITLKLLSYYVPGLCASLSWSHNRLFKVIVPAVCMALFMIHPVGGQAWLYSMLWLMPIAAYMMNINYLFIQSLSATFVAHAVGSVLSLYAMPMTPQVWLALIPIALLERLAIAGGMSALHIAYQQIVSYTAHRSLLQNAKSVLFGGSAQS